MTTNNGCNTTCTNTGTHSYGCGNSSLIVIVVFILLVIILGSYFVF